MNGSAIINLHEVQSAGAFKGLNEFLEVATTDQVFNGKNRNSCITGEGKQTGINQYNLSYHHY